MTAQDGTYQRLTVSEAATVLGVSRMTVRRMIQRGQLEAERVHRPQGSVFVVRLPVDGTEQGTPTAHVPRYGARPSGTEAPPAEAMVSLIQTTIATVLGPLVTELAAARQANERQAEQLVSQAETIGRQAAEIEALRAAQTLSVAPGAPQPVETTTNTRMARLRTLASWVPILIMLALAVVTLLLTLVVLALTP